jgi:translation initiation factor IF-2
MPSSRRSPSPEVAALRAAAEGSCKQLRDQTREQARLIRSSAVGELTEADVERMAADIAAAARQADAELRKAWRARPQEAGGRRWRR